MLVFSILTSLVILEAAKIHNNGFLSKLSVGTVRLYPALRPISIFSESAPLRSKYALFSSNNGVGSDNNLLEQMRKSLGEREDVFEEMETENKQLLRGLRDLDRDPNLKANNRFLEWLEENGVWVKYESAWGRAPHPLVISSSTEDEGEFCGRGLLAREPISEGELLMTVPLDLCLAKSVAVEMLGNDVVAAEMDEYIAIALLLMVERCKGSSSRWKPYFDVLPDVGDVYPSFLWTDAELDQLKGSPTFFSSGSLR